MDDVHPSRTYKVLPVPQVPQIPMLQRETASIQPEKIDTRSARNLLCKVFKKPYAHPPAAKKLQANHVQFLLETPIGRDFNLITAAGVEFKVHSIMLIGGPKALQEGLFPGGATIPNPPEFVNLPPHFHPILMDRIVNFIYTSDYLVVRDGSKQLIQKNFKFYHATVIPDVNPPTAATTALVDIHDYTFHLHMYALAEELDYDALKSAAHTKLVQLFITVRNETPSAIKDAINATFAPLGSPSRICKDEDSMLQQLVVAAVLAHEFKTWTEADQQVFSNDIQGPEYADFRNAYNMVKGANQDLIEIGDTARSLAAERKAGMERRRAAKKAGVGNLDQSKLMVGSGSPLSVLSARPANMKDKFKRCVEKRGVSSVAKVDGDEDMDMEVD
ncbi:uncharacterized protein J4E87_005405 [Alternaria ethzedia]|uniref:uncharacterized protein n=1 Tax=Alternaria ethzedia TaxID=181014 RepID=UPI0020C48EF9|nr:uncharacterized protein J4E87_005405 [Alternaria ethzedia]KAI4624924.1 hypothetical protein J4E87_005405 [Alternaria ethzedia]